MTAWTFNAGKIYIVTCISVDLFSDAYMAKEAIVHTMNVWEKRKGKKMNRKKQQWKKGAIEKRDIEKRQVGKKE